MELNQCKTLDFKAVSVEEYDYSCIEEYGLSFKQFDIVMEMFETHFQVTPVFHQKVKALYTAFLDQGFPEEEIVSMDDEYIEFTPMGLQKVSMVLDTQEYSYWEELESHIRYVLIKLLSQYREEIIVNILKLIYVQLLEQEQTKKIGYLEYAAHIWIPDGFIYIY